MSCAAQLSALWVSSLLSGQLYWPVSYVHSTAFKPAVCLLDDSKSLLRRQQRIYAYNTIEVEMSHTDFPAQKGQVLEQRDNWNPVGQDMQLLASPFSAESRHADAPFSCSFAIYTFIHIFNHLYCRERSEWVNETDVGSWRLAWHWFWRLIIL